jgi:hypothetical protein
MFPFLCSAATVQASTCYLNPDLCYQSPAMPAVPGAPTTEQLTAGTTPTEQAAYAAALPGTLAAAALAQTQAENQSIFTNMANSIANITAPNPTACTQTILPSLGLCDSTIYWGLGIAGFVLLFAVSSGGRRR